MIGSNNTIPEIEISMNILRPQPVVRSIGEHKWDGAKRLMEEMNNDTAIIVSMKYEYMDLDVEWDLSILPSNVLRQIVVHILELVIGQGRRTYLRHTIDISGKKWRQNNLESENELARWILEHPEAIDRIHTEEEVEGVMSNL